MLVATEFIAIVQVIHVIGALLMRGGHATGIPTDRGVTIAWKISQGSTVHGIRLETAVRSSLQIGQLRDLAARHQLQKNPGASPHNAVAEASLRV
jgi:hypothetical protein